MEETFGAHNRDINKHNNDNNKQFSVCGKSMIAAVILVVISLAAVSISEFAIPTSSTKSIKLDSVSRPIYATLQDYEKEALFRVFVDDYGKMYKTDEYQTKLSSFKEFLELCDSRNMAEAAVGSTAVHGVTMFADLTPTEFATYLGFVQSSTTSYGELVDSDKITAYNGTETEVDWTDIYTTSVRTQGYCGSCWAFSAVQQIESDTIRIVGNPYTTTSTLSVQQLVSCDSTNSGCSGGDARTGYEYVMETGGLNMESNYPYTSYYDFAGSCDKTKSGYSIAVAQYYTITGADATTVETNMINYVKTTGPLSVCIDASEWSSYVSGTVAVCSSSPNHCVQIVGVNDAEGYWKIRNSWGTSWGEDGYIRLQLNADTCAITTIPTYTFTYLYGTTLSPTATPTTPYPSFEPTTASPSFEPTTASPTTASPSFEPTAEEVEEEEEEEEEVIIITNIITIIISNIITIITTIVTIIIIITLIKTIFRMKTRTRTKTKMLRKMKMLRRMKMLRKMKKMLRKMKTKNLTRRMLILMPS